MIRVGLIGESPNDTKSFQNLFARRYPGVFDFFSLVKNRTGGQLDDIKEDSKTLRDIRYNYQFEKPDFVVLIRDSDALESETDKFNDRLQRLFALGNAVTHNAVYLLCVWEMETLLLADLDTVNNMFGTSLVYPGAAEPPDPMLKVDPKQFLVDNCGYKVNDCPELFKKIDFNKLLNVRFFNEFVPKFEQRIK